MTVESLVTDLGGEHAAEALSALCALAKTAQGRTEIEERLSDHAVFETLKNSPQPKVRKNLYRLIGAL